MQPFAVGVTLYLTMPEFPLPGFKLFVSVCVITLGHEEAQLLKPVMAWPDRCAAVHVKVAPVMGGFSRALRSIFVVSPEQMDICV